MKLSVRKLIIFWIGVIIAAITAVFVFIFPSDGERIVCAGFVLLGLDGVLSLILLRCPYCGKSIHIFGMRYCPSCGEDLTKE